MVPDGTWYPGLIDRTDTGPSAPVVGTGLHAPLPTIPRGQGRRCGDTSLPGHLATAGVAAQQPFEPQGQFRLRSERQGELTLIRPSTAPELPPRAANGHSSRRVQP